MLKNTNIINKKTYEFGEDIFGISYEAFVENNIFAIKLDVKNDENLLLEYHIYDIATRIDRIVFIKEKSASFQLKKFGNLRARIYAKKIDSTKIFDYSFISEYINYNEKTVFEYLRPNKQNYIEAISQISSIIEAKNKKTETIKQVINNLHAISSFNYSITEYFKEQGIHEVSIFGNQDEIELSKLIYINVRYARDFDLKYCLCLNSYFEYWTPLIIGRNMLIKHLNINKTIIFNKNDIILVCTSTKDESILNDIRNKTKAKVIHILDVIRDILLTQFYTKRLLEIKNNNSDIPIIFCSLPCIWFIKNKSEIERKTQDNFYLKNKITHPALERFGYSFEDGVALRGSFELIRNNNIPCCKNINSKYRNVVNNFRLTTDQPDNFKNTIYIFGNSVAFGVGAEDSDTMQSCLQRIINGYFMNKESYCVLNCANCGGEDFDQQTDLMEAIDFKSGDIIICISHLQDILKYAKKHFIPCPTQHAFERPHDMGEVFIDGRHLNKIGYTKIAELLFQTILDGHLFDNKIKVDAKNAKVFSIANLNDYFKAEVATKKIWGGGG